ncbi:MAG TPA: porin family protein [Thermoanaerobaculia bacterium]
MNLRLFLVLGLAVLSLPVAAQSNEMAVWITAPQVETLRRTDPNASIERSFEDDPGWGLSVSRYWTRNLATELAFHRIQPGSNDVMVVNGRTITTQGPHLDLTAWSATAQWHFGVAGRIDPYLGAGAAHVSGDMHYVHETTEDVRSEFDSEFTWVANAGFTLRLTPRIAASLDAKYIPYAPDADPHDSIFYRPELNPLILAAGLRLRF